MAVGLKPKVKVDGLEEFKKYIEYVKKLASMRFDKPFQKYIQDLCLKTVEQVTNQRLTGGTTNDDSIGLYKSSNHIRETENGFVLYNDAKIPAIALGLQNDAENYPDGMFSIALAFEYGVGIIGSNTNNPNAWEYNMQGYNFGWYLPSSVAGQSGVMTGGYQGFEIYRYTAEEINNNLKKWVLAYEPKKDGGVSL